MAKINDTDNRDDSSRAHAASSRLSSEQVQHLRRFMKLQKHFGKMDNRELCWHFIEFVDSLNLGITNPADSMCETIVDRLYPEYDGDEITRQEYGWLTPEGRVEYLFSNSPVLASEERGL